MLDLTTEHVNHAECPVCRYGNNMPLEYLRHQWEPLDCDRCGAALEYRGVHVHQSWEYEIHTRTKAPDLILPVKGIYFDQIRDGTKTHEYRLTTPFWRKRISGRRYSRVILTRGYPKGGGVEGITRLTREWRGSGVQTLTHPHFGPEPVEVFAIDVTTKARGL